MQEDYLKREINRLGLVLSTLVCKLLGKDKGQSSEEILFAVTCSMTELDINLTTLLSQPPNIAANEVWRKLKESPNLLEQFADSLVASGTLLEKRDTKLSIGLLKIGMACYTKYENETRAFSFSIKEKQNEIAAILDNIETD